VRRATARLAPARIGAALVLAVAIGGLYLLSTVDAFVIRRTEITGNVWTTQAQILKALAVPIEQNAFEVSTAELGTRLSAVTAVRLASIRVVLPDQLQVAVTEREPLLLWQVGGRRYLVDADGLLFASLADASGAPAAAAALPLVDDRRSEGVAITTGSHLDAVTLDAALRLASLTPADMGSTAKKLVLKVDDQDGFSIAASPAGWTAVFGFYTPNLRSTELVPGQVRLLRSLLYGREAGVLRVVLADDRSGTYIPKPAASGKPAASNKPGASAKPAATPKPSVKP
jgi:cell division septal protein FtsQ